MSTPNPTQSLRVPLPLGLTPHALAFLAVVIAALILALEVQGGSVTFNPGALQNIGQAFAPMFVAAAFVERAVEVIITPLRGDQADRLESAARQATAAAAADPSRAPDAARLAADVLNYKLRTRHYAFILSTAAGLVAALVGFRGLSAMVASVPAGSETAFRAFDTLVTGMVIGGGADGIHKVVSAVLDYAGMVSRTTQGKADA